MSSRHLSLPLTVASLACGNIVILIGILGVGRPFLELVLAAWIVTLPLLWSNVFCGRLGLSDSKREGYYYLSMTWVGLLMFAVYHAFFLVWCIRESFAGTSMGEAAGYIYVTRLEANVGLSLGAIKSHLLAHLPVTLFAAAALWSTSIGLGYVIRGVRLSEKSTWRERLEFLRDNREGVAMLVLAFAFSAIVSTFELAAYATVWVARLRGD